ncbi:putative crossover junction endonuclease EME1 isoform X1 [Apostichopus japonicus]|uniref:Putative crossover junction endonuclease EME1 isoform X1 n=1 Tax=Stichopus japonicus TaxID=307972 RepID=A0A2G8JE14_STIJA|nr:putative crossover junction endonuclease EME1 isoform X1 [Apostichopus japonicus]
MESQVQEVLAICPNVSVEVIKRDLLITDSVSSTVNRILDGVVELSNEDSHFSAPKHCSTTGLSSSPGKIKIVQSSSVFCSGYSSDSSDDDRLLPSISLNTKVKRTIPSDQSHVIPTEGEGHEDIVDLISCEDFADDANGIKISESGVTTRELKPDGTKVNSDSVDNKSNVLKISESSSPLERTGSKLISEDDILGNNSRIFLPVSNEAETLDLTNSDSSDADENQTKLKNSRIAISSSDESNYAESDGEIVKVNFDANPAPLTNQTVEDNEAANSASLENRAESSINYQASKPKMIEVSSSDDSEDELPLWKRVQRKKDQSLPANVDAFRDGALSKNEKVSKTGINLCPENSKLNNHSNPDRSSFSSDGKVSNVTSLPSAVVESESSQSSVTSKGEKRKMRSLEEIQSAKEQALQRRTERERQRELQNRKREEKQKEMEHRKALREAHKALRPEECMKSGPASFGKQVWVSYLRKLQDLECKVAILEQPIEGAISWSRQQNELNLGHDIQLGNLTKTVVEEETLVITRMDQFVHFLHATTQERLGGIVDGETLDMHTRRCMQTLGGKSMTYIVSGVQQYFRNSKNRHQRNFRSAVLGSEDNNKKTKRGKKKANLDNLPDVSRVQMEEALVDLQLQIGCNVRFCETPDAVSDFIAMFTKAVAEKPFKKQRDKATFSFHVNSEWAGGAKVAKNGSGLIKVWKQQLQQFRNVSPEMATAVINQYPSPQLLLQGYRRCSSTKEAEMLLQDIVIRRGEGVLATSRRIGPELSRRVYKQMTSRDGTLLL